MSDDAEYIAKYVPGRLYLNPGKQGVYVTMADENEVVLGEINVTQRCKIAVSAFYVNERNDFSTYKINKLRFRQNHGWVDDGSISINNFQLDHIKTVNSILCSLDLYGAEKSKVDFGEINIDTLKSLLQSDKAINIIENLSNSPNLDKDIFALYKKRSVINEFSEMLKRDEPEKKWQNFFEDNPWIFGHGLNYVFLDKVGPSLETVTTGAEFQQFGKRADALLRTRAEISQFVLIEIKKNRTRLLQDREYRSGCWDVTGELTGAISQTQKTVYEFSRKRFRERLKDSFGNDLNDEVFAVDPKSYLIVGSLDELRDNENKVACFELFRRNIRAPEILTFDELFYRAKHMVDNMSSASETTELPPFRDYEDIPF